MFERFSAQARGVVVDAVAGSGPVTPMELLTALLTSDRASPPRCSPSLVSRST